jgi:hypothetical protein
MAAHMGILDLLGDEDFEHRCEICGNAPTVDRTGLCEHCLETEQQAA